MLVTILQPTYLPWLGYFEMIDAADLHIVLDHVQFSKQSWQQRNRIKTRGGELMLTVPVLSQKESGNRILDKEINYKTPWVKKHLRSVQQAYSRAPFFAEHYEGFDSVLEQKPPRLVDLNLGVIRFLIERLGIETPVSRSSEILQGFDDSGLDRCGRLINLLGKVGAGAWYEGAVGRDFVELPRFESAGISVRFQEYDHPVYEQQSAPFLPYVSTLDLLFNCGPRSLEIVRSGAGR